MAAANKTLITHIVFDMDGLLLDTEIFYTLVQEKILARFGKTFDWSLKAKMMGKKAIESARIFVEDSGLQGQLTPEAFIQEREAMLQDLFPTCELMPGAKRLISYLHSNGIPMAVATGSHKRHFSLKTQRHGEIFSMMHHVVMGDDPEVKNGKPSPDVFLAAAKRFDGNVDPRKILVFEDAPAGAAAAKNAGIMQQSFTLVAQAYHNSHPFSSRLGTSNGGFHVLNPARFMLVHIAYPYAWDKRLSCCRRRRQGRIL